jgi:hypothetical protein
MPLKNTRIIISLIAMLTAFLYAQDGPYFFYTDKADSVISVSADLNNVISADTIKVPEIVRVQLPGSEEFFYTTLSENRKEEQFVFPEPDRLFAMSDIEGNFKDFVTILTNNGIIDDELKWSFGKGHLVLNGDFLDRGELVTQVLWLIYKLELEAEKAGGKVHYLLGNHEVMILQGDDRYAVEKYHDLAKQTGRTVKDYFAPDTHFGKWMRGRNVIEKIGRTIFVHGGLSDTLAQAGLSFEQINNISRMNIDKPDSLLSSEAGLISGTYGVLWYRGMVTDHKNYGRITNEKLDGVLSIYDADRIVVGHCIVEEVSSDYSGKVIRIDVDHYEEESCGIFIENGKIYKAMKSGERNNLK